MIHQKAHLEVSRRTAGLLLIGTAWQLSSASASALKWETLERVAKDPSILKNSLDQDKTDAAVKRWKRATNMVKGVGKHAQHMWYLFHSFLSLSVGVCGQIDSE